MKLIILKSNLKNALHAVERSVAEHASLPILGSVLLRASKKLSVIATNLEIGVTYEAAGKISEPGDIAIPFSSLNTIVSNTVNERITLEVLEQNLIVKTDNYEAKIQGVSADDFPIIPAIDETQNTVTVSGDTLKTALSQVVVAAGVSELKPELSSVLCKIEAGMIKFVATDGFRLAEKTLLSNDFSTTVNRAISFLIPLKTAQEIIRIFNDDDEIQVSIDSHQLECKTGTTTLVSRLIDGEYPDYEKIIPQTIPVEFLCDRKEFLAGIKLVSAFSGKTSDVVLQTGENGKTLEVYAANQGVGENNYIIPVKKQKDDAMEETSFNWRYLFDGIKGMPGETLRFGFVSPTKPAMLRPADDENLLYIVMPIQG